MLSQCPLLFLAGFVDEYHAHSQKHSEQGSQADCVKSAAWRHYKICINPAQQDALLQTADINKLVVTMIATYVMNGHNQQEVVI